jgi:hypothetical protein
MWYASRMAGDSDDIGARDEVDALYVLDPAEFVSARDALAKDLKSSGDPDAARDVKALKRPTKAAWAINQVARSHAGEVHDLLEAGATLRDRQAEALSGGDAGALREAAAERREAVRALVAHVVALAGDGVREDAAGTFEAASVDEAIGALVAAGRLTAVVSRPSDMGFGGMPDPPARAAPRRTAPARGRAPRTSTPASADPPPPVRLDRRRIEKLQRQLTAAEREAGEADDALADADRRLARAVDAVVAAEAKRDEASAARDAAADRRAEAMRRVESVRADLDDLVP